jgi:hypothetical protein
MPTETRSNWSSAERPTQRAGAPVEARSPWSSPSRADGGHLGPHTAGKGWTPLSRRDNVPVAGEPRDVIEDRRR